MDASLTATIAEPISGEKLYQVRARAALPLLVRQAEAGRTIFYSDLAEELGMPNPRNLNYVLGSIGQTLENLSHEWGESIPPLQCLVINRASGLPGEGIAWFLSKTENFSNLSKAKQREVVHTETGRIRAYQWWLDVLEAVGLDPVRVSFEKMNELAALEGFGGGESERHRLFKEFIARNPSVIGLPEKTGTGETEVRLPSGDALDVAFRTRNEWVGAEVKSSISSNADLIRGLYQCVKYQAVMQAVEASENRERSARSVLVLEAKLPPELVSLRNILGITVHDNVGLNSSFTL